MFIMFEKTFPFLRAIRDNNNREWYHANKDIYNEAKIEFEHVTELLINETGKFDKDIRGLLPKDCIFRIFRDVRFSSDKSPYKSNFGAFLSKGGKKGGFAGYYLHIEPDSSFIAGGIYLPPSPQLRAIREDILENIDEFKEILSEPGFKKHFGGISADSLKTIPKGFSKDLPDVELLKYTSYTVMKAKKDKELTDIKSLNEITDAFHSLFRFNRFMNEAIIKVL
jgi:uncharacterized protein (TIGR02453 family)